MASAIIRSVAVHSRPALTIHLADCICINNGVSSECSSPYRPKRLPPVAPYKPPPLDDESFDFSASKTSKISSPLCACLNCTKTAPFCFDRFKSDIISTSTAVDLRKDKTLRSDHLQAIVEYSSVEEDAAALGALSKKQSPLFGRKKHNDSSAATLAQSFSLRTEEPFYAQQIIVGPTTKNGSGEQKHIKNQHKIDHNAVEAISMSVGVANGAAGSPNNGTDINRNNGQLRNGVS